MKKLLANLFFFFSLFLTIVIIFFVVVAKDKNDIYIFDYKPFIIGSGSMEPKYLTKSLVIIKKGGYDKVKIDDVIAFKVEKGDSKLVFHRVVKKTKKGFVTKGDNNDHNDDQVIDKKAFIGKEVYHTNFTAYYINGIQTPFGVIEYVIVPIVLIVFISISIYLFTKWNISKKKKLLIVATLALLFSVMLLILYNMFNNKRVEQINTKLEKAVIEFNNNQTATTKVEGSNVIGIITIPKINLSYPIIKYINKESLNQSITHFSGPELNEIGNVSLAGHRANGNVFFTNLDKLVKDDIVKIKDINNRLIEYKVTDTFYVKPEDTSVLKDKEKNKRELTLISCGKSNKVRLIIKLTEKK
jgi:signal peptidase I, archaeal type